MTRVLSLGVVLLLCFATVFADNILIADFIERKSTDAYGYTRGKVYYKYDGTCGTPAAGQKKCSAKDDRIGSRILFQYEVGGTVVDNLYHYGDGALYSMCTSSCSGILLNHKADPWYYDSNYYTKGVQDASGLYWYNRTDYGTNNIVTFDIVSPQVTSILMDEGAWGSQQIKTIIFNDGRVVTLSGVQFATSGYDDKFTVRDGINCPKATCPIYADLVFVLDNSGSVDNTEWKQTATFVNKVIDTFAFGEDAANAAVIQFNAPRIYNCHYKTHYYTSGGRQYSCSIYDPDYDCMFRSCSSISSCNDFFTGKDTASLIAGKNVLTNISTVTVSVDADSIKNNMTGTRPYCYGNTCQGYGLELAYYVLKNSPRTRYGRRPQPIVIAVTDGQDFCPNKTKKEADRLRREFGAFVVEVGVGMSSSCGGYDVSFLKSVASSIGSADNPAYYDVTDYNAIKELSDKLFKPICDGFNGGCGPDCHGFCGCGTCMCPTCENLNSTCAEVTCTADQSSSTGCVKKDIPCGEETVCEWYECDGSKDDDHGRCTKVENKCEALLAANPGTCRQKAECSPSAGGCYLQLNHAFCNTYHEGDQCVEYECTPEGEEPLFADTGCRIKLNKTLAMEQEFERIGKWCATAVCDPQTGVTEGTSCTLEGQSGELANGLCYDPVCVKKGSSYDCSTTPKNRPADDDCTHYGCPDMGKGWQPIWDWDMDYCVDKLGGADATKCHYVDCHSTCTKEPIALCNCSTEQDTYCRAEAVKISSVKQCIYGACISVNGQPKCEMDVIVKDCDAELGAEIEATNLADPGSCWTAECDEGHCKKKKLDDHANTPVDNICMSWQCKKNEQTGQWSWQYTDTLLGLNCKNDTCGFRVCVPEGADKGCKFINNTCEPKSDICSKFSCNITTEANGRIYRNCEEESLLEVTTCTREVCSEDRQSKKIVDNLDACTLSQTYKCLQPNCAYDKQAHTSECYYTDRPEPGDDPCKLYTCHNDTGEWDIDQKCVDGDLCTEDICNVFGECRFPAVTCSELSMDAYPCYYRQCIPDPDNNKYICKRKHIKGAMIDLCGQCIMEKDDVNTRSVSDSMLHDSKFASEQKTSSSEVSLVECTNAGPRPLLTEGLAAASIALIILAAVVIGAGIAASGVIGTKTLIKRARGANNQSAHTNPLFQENEAEMSNPAFIEDKEA